MLGQPFDNPLAGLINIACAHRNQQVARFQQRENTLFQRLLRLAVVNNLTGTDLQLAQYRFPVDSRNRRFSGSIDIGQYYDVSRRKGRTELAGQ